MLLTLRRPVSAVATVAALVALVAGALTAGAAPAVAGRDVNPFIGTGGRPPWFSGNTNPAASRPFGMVQLGPDTTADPAGTPSAGSAGYLARDPLLRGFSPTHVSGAGCRTFGDVPILPVTGPLRGNPSAATVPLDKATEQATPGRYAVRLTNGVSASMAAAPHSAVMELRYARSAPALVLVKADASLAGTSASSVRFLNRREIAVSVTSGRFCDAPNRYRVFVVLRFERPIGRHGTWRDGRGGAWVAVGGERVARIQVGVSFVSVAGARRNLAADHPGWSVARLAARAAADWTDTLDRVQVTGGTSTERQLFDTALYRVFQHPSTISDADGRYPGFDGQVHRLRPGERQLSAISGWDYYRTHAPLLAWVRPDVAAEVVRSLLRDAGQSGRLPRWPVVNAETGIMNGDAAAPAIAATYAFGARDFDLDEAVARLVEQGDTVQAQDGYEPRPGLADYLLRGYVPDPVLERGAARSHGASTTLEYATADFAISRLAGAAGQSQVAQRYHARSGSWQTLLDPARGLFAPRDAAGDFLDPSVGAARGFEEGSATQYTWGGVPQDLGGLLSALGTPQETSDRLDTFFGNLNVGGGAQAWLGNEPSFATPWNYHWIGRPTRSQDVVARARAELWSTGPDGLPGNDDLGALSAWYVWASLGLYPVTPGTATVAIGVPAFSSVTVQPSSGPPTRIVRTGTGAHVGAVSVDGAAQTRSWLDLGPRVQPRLLTVTTTDDPAPAWGTQPDDAPPSYPS